MASVLLSDYSGATTLAPRELSEKLWYWLLSSVRATLGLVFISINAMLPFSHLPEMHPAECVLLVASSVLSVDTGLVLLLWAAYTTRDRG